MNKLIKIVSVIFLILNYTLGLNAQNDTLLLKYSPVKLNKDYFKSYLTDYKDKKWVAIL
jgi:hypothetical protein